MDLHEYQTKEILKINQIPISDFVLVERVEDTDKALKQLEVEQAVVKIQVHAGGRGKAGGVKIGKTPEEIKMHVENLLGMKVINNQTGSKGVVANKVIITKLVDYKKEYYLACVIDRKSGKGFLIASSEGGVDIEEVAKTDPEKILKLELPLKSGLKSYEIYPFVKKWGFEGVQGAELVKFIQNLIKVFQETDASLLEINPLVLTNDNKWLALDAKLSIDDNALFRHPDLAKLYDPSQVSEREAHAHEHDLAYIALEGDIGCMVNGAGLAMATMDIIKTFGRAPANFLDVGGGATKEKVAEGFKIILSDPNVKAILINIFGGIMNCETLALGIVDASNEIGIKVPLVVRMEGTNVEKGKKILADSKLNIVLASDLKDAAEKVTKV